jgi:carbamoyltransferase
MASPRYVLGVNLTRTRDGIALDDGAAALLDDGAATVAIAQERLTRRKHDGGAADAARYCLDSQGHSLSQVGLIAVSSCCDVPPDPAFALDMLAAEGLPVSKEQLRVVPSHHLSHAASAYYPSGFDEAVVIVADNEGNILGEPQHRDYWRNRLERTSVYLGCGNDLRLLRRYGDRPGELSLGAAYNHFTKWLGFTSYHDAGKVMALAAYGRGYFDGVDVFSICDGDVSCLLPKPSGNSLVTNVAEPLPGPPDEFDREAARLLHGESVRQLVAEQAGVDIGPARSCCREPDEIQQELAWLIQTQLERALVEIVRRTVARTGVSRVCLAGGVALNCVANTLVANLPEVSELFIQPAASDVGQALGNAIWAYRQENATARRWVMRSCSLGRPYTRTDIDNALPPFRHRITVEQTPDPAATAARLIAGGQIIGWFDGGSEYGLRGLGRRSVLGDPRTKDTKTRLDAVIKRREPFRPYAPSILEEEVTAWFDVDSDFKRTAAQPMNCMFVAPRIRPERRSQVPAVTFIDGTARLHSVSREENPRYHDLIRHFRQLTGVPLILNTSFNAGGDPVVETPQDAVNSMFKMSLDALVIGDLVIRQKP